MIVNVIQRNATDLNMKIITLKISPFCPICGEKRGKPEQKSFCEDGEWYVCDTWNNPCGHVDLYKDVIQEAQGN